MPATSELEATEKDLVIVREFNAPRDLVWKVWTEGEHIEKWWGPRGFDTKVVEMDLRPGGKWHYTMVGPDGMEYPVKGVISEIVPPERIVTTDEFGEGFEDAHPDLDLPKGIVSTALFEDLGSRCRLILRIAHSTIEDRKKHEDMGVVAGWNSSFDCMDEYLIELQK
jgi:uncharacterized protein YndB with AHSA1/START domain